MNRPLGSVPFDPYHMALCTPVSTEYPLTLFQPKIETEPETEAYRPPPHLFRQDFLLYLVLNLGLGLGLGLGLFPSASVP